MRVAVSAASRHHSTEEIAARLGSVLRSALPPGSTVDVLPPADLRDIAAYDVVVLGSAVYMGRWLESALDAAARIVAAPARSVWLFSSGPIGLPAKPLGDPAGVGALLASTRARGHAVFAGRLDRQQLSLSEKALMTAIRVTPGDFRDWAAIDGWGRQIAVDAAAAAKV